MSKLSSVVSKLKYLGFLGIPMFFSDLPMWRYFWLFWLFGIVEILLSLTVFLQAIKQLLAIPYTYIRYRFKLPDRENFLPVIQYSLPFDGEWTVVNGGVDKNTSHSWNIQAQRYAYDFVVLDCTAKSFSECATVLENYYCYGKNILSPADGIVVECNGTLPNSRPFGNGKTDPNIKDIRGNFIVILHAEREYSLLAHLMPNSVTVKVGETVKRGQVIAQCGNSGNTTEPHLHFQIQDTKSMFFSVGLPVHFENVHKKAAENYSSFDQRTINMDIDLESPFIERGQSVSNS